MKILYYYPVATKHGAKSILHYYYSKALEDKLNFSYFITSDDSLRSIKNVRVILVKMHNYRLFRRFFLDFFYIRKVIRRDNIDQVINFQNTLIPFIKTNQTIYLHQALIFSKIQYNIVLNPILWFYTKIYSCLVLWSIIRVKNVILQTNHMKSELTSRINREINISVNTPILQVSIPENKSLFVENQKLNLFYPTSDAIYKNYYPLFEAVLKISSELKSRLNLIVTLDYRKSRKLTSYKKKFDYNQISVKFIGQVPHEEVLSILNESVLVFPSLIESLGLPLLEAKVLKKRILAINKPYSVELLRDYTNVAYFELEPNYLKDLTCLINHELENYFTAPHSY
jgi:hypothetical protein